MFGNKRIYAEISALKSKVKQLEHENSRNAFYIDCLKAAVSYPERLKLLEEYKKYGGSEDLVVYKNRGGFYRESDYHVRANGLYTDYLQDIVNQLKAEWVDKHQCEVKK